MTTYLPIVCPKFNLLICNFIFDTLPICSSLHQCSVTHLPRAISLTRFITKSHNKINQTLLSPKQTHTCSPTQNQGCDIATHLRS